MTTHTSTEPAANEFPPPYSPLSETCAPVGKQSEIVSFPHAFLPRILRDFSSSLAAASPVPIAFAATTCLAVLSAALGAGAVHHDGERRIRPNLYFLTVAPDSIARETCFRLAYDPLAAHQQILDQAHGPERAAEFPARKHQNTREWWRIQDNRTLTRDEKDRLYIEKDLELAHLELALKSTEAPHVFLTHIPKGKLHAHLAAHAGQSVAFFTADATQPAQIFTGRLRSMALDEQTYAAAHAGRPVSSAQRFDHRRTTLDPCLTLHWSLTPESCDRILAAREAINSPLLPRFIYLKSETCPKSGVQGPASPFPSSLPAIPAELKASWSATISTLLAQRVLTSPVQYSITEAARDHLRAFENEIQEGIRNCANPLQSAFIAHHPDLAYRLALLLHAIEQASHQTNAADSPSATELEQLETRDSEPETSVGACPEPIPLHFATAAVALTRFFSEQHRLLSDSLCTVADRAMLEKLKRIIEDTHEGVITLGKLKDSHNIQAVEVQRLAAKYPDILKLGPAPYPTRGPKFRNLSLCKDPSDDSAPPTTIVETPRHSTAINPDFNVTPDPSGNSQAIKSELSEPFDKAEVPSYVPGHPHPQVYPPANQSPQAESNCSELSEPIFAPHLGPIPPPDSFLQTTELEPLSPLDVAPPFEQATQRAVKRGVRASACRL